MKVLVTGTDGYIGVLLAPFLAERGHEVVGLDTGFYRDGWLYPGPAAPAVSLNRDLRSITEQDLRGFDAIAHLAELSNDPLGQHRPEITYEINHRGSVELARKCKACGITRFVYTSSCSVYGIAGGEQLKTEESNTNPQTAYAHCKVLVERDVAALADDAFSPTFLRNATAYGPSPRMRFDIVLNNLAGLACTTREIRMTSDGTPWRPLVHVLDICEAVACALEAPRPVVHNQIYNVGNSRENYQVRELAQIIAAAFPGCSLSFGSSDGDNRSYRVGFEKIQQRLPGFACSRSARDGAAELFELFERIKLSKETFEFRAYTRLKQLQYLLQTKQIDDRLYWTAS